jgi:hypothetical protein
MKLAPLAPLAPLLALTASLAGQVGRGETGLQLVSGGVTYGVTCSPTFSCSYLPASLVRGMPATIVVRGVLGRPFVLGFGADQPHQCLSLPGLHNQLMGPLLTVPVVGTLTMQDSIRACPGGVISIPLQVPASLPRGTALTMQALAWSYLVPNETPTFTQALRVVVI